LQTTNGFWAINYFGWCPLGSTKFILQSKEKKELPIFRKRWQLVAGFKIARLDDVVGSNQ
jgi:hypothetical protein